MANNQHKINLVASLLSLRIWSLKSFCFYFQVNHLFAGADDDVDGILSASEIVKNHELFVGSEATDYGEHLQNPNRLDDEL